MSLRSFRAGLTPMLACAALTAALAPTAAAAGSRAATRVVLNAPKGGDLSYAVVQVRVGRAKAPRKVRGASVFTTKVGGEKVAAVSAAWSKLRATTKAYVVVTRVAGGPANLRNLTFVITRKAGRQAKGSGSITFTAPGTTPATGSFWVHKVSSSGVADVFHGDNAVATAVTNWSRYLSVLRAANALRAALHPLDVHGTFRDKPTAGAAAMAHGAAAPVLSIGGAKPSALGRKLITLVFGTLADRNAFQALKRSTLVTDFLRKDLNNPKLAAQFGQIAAALPSAVPDAYAANAKEEARFGHVSQPRIAHASVVISDAHNASEQAAIETPRSAADTLPGQRVVVQFAGSADAGTVRGYGYQDGPAIRQTVVECRTACSQFWPQGVNPDYEAVPDDGVTFGGWEGCTGGTGHRGATECNLKAPTSDHPPTATIIATFNRPAAPTTAGGSGPGATTSPTPTGSAGTLDTSFGANGYTLTDVPGGLGFGATGLARQSTGKLVQVGTGDTGAIHTKVLRYLADGKLDAGFGSAGVLTLPDMPAGNEFYGVAVAIDALDRMVIAGQVKDAGTGEYRLGVVRLTPDGAVDTTFGSGGWVDLTVGTDGYVAPHAVSIAGDGSIYVAGYTIHSGQSAVALAALDASGASQAGFGTGGVVVDQPDGRSFGASGMALTAAGLVLVGGDADGPVVVRYTTTGTVDPSFDGGHVLVMAPGGAYARGSAQAIVEQADGRLVTAGYVEKADNSGTCLIAQRLTAAGAADASFGTGGTTVVCNNTYSGAEAVAVDADGVYAAGHAYSTSQSSILLARFTAAGALDPTFDGGTFSHSAAGDSYAQTMLLQDGNPVLGGSGTTGSTNQFLIERVLGH